MDILYNLGFSNQEIDEIIEICPGIKGLTFEEIIINIEVLKQIGCKDRHIKHIILSNPNYLLESSYDVCEVISYFNELGITSIYLLFDTNPFLLTISKNDLEIYVENKLKNGFSLEEISDLLEKDFYIL